MFFQGQTLYWTYLRNGWSDWCETKRRCIGWILGELCDLDLWPHTWPWPCNFNVKVCNSLIWGMGGLIDMEWKRCELIIHDHDCDLCLTLVGWVDVPYSDLGDLRRRRAVDISSFSCDNCENTCALCYCHHQIGSMNHLPLFRVRLWNKILGVFLRLWNMIVPRTEIKKAISEWNHMRGIIKNKMMSCHGNYFHPTFVERIH